ncbi:PPK2 family polyphosphate kinase [Tomitella biformata]|uniref:PPK2 family polyphosphate kinase n=1 Tax=Tomitella biformata TaxID=630403 RepID=UPI0004647C7A|nr:PPK2 family polyphosphate kinase [Tomitella biformata]
MTQNTRLLPKHWTETPSEVLRMRAGLRIAEFDANSTPGFKGDKSAAKELIVERGDYLSKLQELLYANGRAGDRRSVLLVLQGMDTSGKGGIVRHVMGLVDPQGVSNHSFGVPTEEEQAQHYLQRIRRALPVGGQIGVFDRSHYEDVLVVRVHDLVPESEWSARYDEINAFEAEVAASGTIIVKVVLVVSFAEQKARLAERLERPDKFWKYSPSDIDERAHWLEYQEAYQAVLDKTSTAHAPWHVVPCDRKWFARTAVMELVIDALERQHLNWPPADFDVEAEKARLAQS